MASQDDDTGEIPTERVQGGLSHTVHPQQDTHYETGTITGVHNQGSHYTFQGDFSSTPNVVLTGIATGSATVDLQGTPALGSFRARTDRAGSFDAYYHALGPP